MIFHPMELDGVLLVETPIHGDERGTFTRTFCRKSFAAHGLELPNEQWSVSGNPLRGTLRGLHYQADPHGETKLVRCARGAAFHAAVDMRPHSPNLGRHVTVELRPERPIMLYVPRGFAHGFLTLADDTEIVYGITPEYMADAARGLLWNDPDIGISWPFPPLIISERDTRLPRLWP
ncbi:MAG: dTDP-4-dehydrorhamnose 3,5-epimerase [Rhodospirillaceae bacterium]|nr:dTDP-4-dehydrorhamnose 3,5-epimerase [Rhodospirillales bacterium]